MVRNYIKKISILVVILINIILFSRIESLFGNRELRNSFRHIEGICLKNGREAHCDFSSTENVLDDINLFARTVLERKLQPKIIIESKSVLQDSVELVKIFGQGLEDTEQ